MIITKLELIDKKRIKVYIDYEYKFLLYETDVKKFKLKENLELEQSTYCDIIENTVYRRAKQKALFLLKYRNRTQKELEIKLKQDYYIDEIVNRTIEYIKSYHYIDDKQYANAYIRTYQGKKGKKQLQMELQRKGVNPNVIEESLEEEYLGEEEAISHLIQKRIKNYEDFTVEQEQKLIASLYRKGFQVEYIKKCLNKIKFDSDLE